MGQQQLLLIALSVIIVGAAVAVGVNLLTEGQSQAEYDKFYQVATQAGVEFGKWYNKPVAMGGGGKNVSIFPTDLGQAAAILGLESLATGESEVYMSAISSTFVEDIEVVGSSTATVDGILITLTHKGLPSGSNTASVVLSGRGRARWDHDDSTPPEQG
ncbi:MAG: hypothetical protein JXQ65_04175 [Candidatus Marinimicrobia bacterium]|nr:hypothetical protein [Candidatus Neomarinimicrobiota bacterium]